MCLNIKLNEHTLKSAPNPKIATADLVCYKIVHTRKDYKRNSKKKRVFESEYQHFKYELKKEYKAEFAFASNNKAINNGLHSYRTNVILSKAGGLTESERNGVQLVVLKCIIPKHTPYYIGDNGDLCSNKLITIAVLPTRRKLDADLKKVGYVSY